MLGWKQKWRGPVPAGWPTRGGELGVRCKPLKVGVQHLPLMPRCKSFGASQVLQDVPPQLQKEVLLETLDLSVVQLHVLG